MSTLRKRIILADARPDAGAAYMLGVWSTDGGPNETWYMVEELVDRRGCTGEAILRALEEAKRGKAPGPLEEVTRRVEEPDAEATFGFRQRVLLDRLDDIEDKLGRVLELTDRMLDAASPVCLSHLVDKVNNLARLAAMEATYHRSVASGAPT
jgi:hypothetical protein